MVVENFILLGYFASSLGVSCSFSLLFLSILFLTSSPPVWLGGCAHQPKCLCILATTLKFPHCTWSKSNPLQHHYNHPAYHTARRWLVHHYFSCQPITHHSHSPYIHAYFMTLPILAFCIGLLTLENKATTQSQNIGQQTPSDGRQYPRRTQLSTAPLQKSETMGWWCLHESIAN